MRIWGVWSFPFVGRQSTYSQNYLGEIMIISQKKGFAFGVFELTEIYNVFNM